MQLVPHRPYPPPHSKTKGQYVDDATLQPPILFDLIGSSQRGVAAKDAVNKRYHNLVGRDDPMFEESGSSVALRFEVIYCLFGFCLLRRLTRLTVARLQILESPGTSPVRPSGSGIEDLQPYFSNRSKQMIGERHGAQSPGRNWQQTFQSPSVYSFRCVAHPVPSSLVSEGLRVLVLFY